MNPEFKKIKEIKFCIPDKLFSINRAEVLGQIIELAGEKEEIGFAGYIEKSYLKNSLSYSVFGDSKKVSLPNVLAHVSDIRNCITKTISKCDKLINVPPLYVFVFPTQNKFIQEQMNGVSGFSPYKKTIHLYINPEVEGWFKKLSETIAHETAHTISHSLFKWETILDILIFEGVAEHFREAVIGGEQSPWTKAISSQKVKEILEKLETKNLLNDKKNKDLYNNLFFGGKEFPQWSGYTIGYILVKNVLENSDKDIKFLMKTKPQKIFELYKKLSK
jgi:uncharacterized protein YjaZ